MSTSNPQPPCQVSGPRAQEPTEARSGPWALYIDAGHGYMMYKGRCLATCATPAGIGKLRAALDRLSGHDAPTTHDEGEHQ